MSTGLSDNAASQVTGNDNQGTTPGANPCPAVIPYVFSSPVGWNAVIVGLLSCILALLCALTFLYYLAYRRRYMKQLSECPSPVALVEKGSASPNGMANGSAIATTAFVNETGKETGNGDFVVNVPTIANGHTSPTHSNGLLANGNADQSELRLLQHEEN